MVDDILEAAARIIERDGLDAVTTNAVATAAGVSVGSLYQYFPNRSAILAELTRRERALLKQGIGRVAARMQDGTLDEALKALVDVAVAHQMARPGLARALEFAEASLHLGVETQILADDMTASVARLLERHGCPNATEAAGDLVAMAKGMIDAAGLAGESDSVAMSARVMRAALGYLRG